MNEKAIEDLIIGIIEDFRPEIKQKFVYNFSDEATNELARCTRMFKPPLISFFTKTIARAPDCSQELIQELINHEVLHTFYSFEERAAIGGADVVNFHQDKSNQLNLQEWRTKKSNSANSQTSSQSN